MSSAGHIMDMINRMKQNRSHQASKKSKYRDRRDHILEDKNGYHLPDLPRERLKESVFLKYLNAAIVLALIGLFLYLIMR